MASETFTTPGTSVWYRAAGVTKVTFTAEGADGGGGGGGPSGLGLGGGGGGGGGAGQSVIIGLAAVSYEIIIGPPGAGGVGESGDGTAGTNTYSNDLDSGVTIGGGGDGGLGGANGGTGGLGGGGAGTVSHSGGNGASATQDGGGGGGRATVNGDGVSATSLHGNLNGDSTQLSGDGGVYPDADGSVGTGDDGGGGGGGSDSSSVSTTGGVGTNGKAIVDYDFGSIALIQQSIDGTVGVPLAISPIVQISDVDSAPDTNAYVTGAGVNVAINTGPSSSFFGGSIEYQTYGNIGDGSQASFDNLAFDTPGTYTLVFYTSTENPIVSDSIVISSSGGTTISQLGLTGVGV